MSLAGLLFVGLTGGGLSALGGFDAKAARDISAKLEGPHRKVKVQSETHLGWASLFRTTISAQDFSLDQLPFTCEPQFGAGGRLDQLRLDLRNFSLAGLEIESLKAEIPDCRFDVTRALKGGQLRLHSTGTGRGSVRITQDALARWITRKFAEIKECTVKIDRDVAWVEGYGEFLFVKTQFAVIAKIEAVEGVRLTLTQPKIYFNWRRADPLAAQAILRAINPVVDLSKDLRLMDAISVDTIRLRDGVVVASGATKIPTKPADNPQ